jgi:hypothetical protein
MSVEIRRVGSGDEGLRLEDGRRPEARVQVG